MLYVCYQGGNRDCGFAAIKMLLANSTKNKDFLFIRKPGKTKDYSFLELKNIAKQYHVVVACYEVPREDVDTLKRGTLLLINEKHLVYLIKVKKRTICYFDPALGRVCIPRKEFIKIFSGKIMECVNVKNAKKPVIEKVRMKPIWMDIVYYLLIGVVFASLMAGFYLIKDNSSVILTMSFLALFAICELVENWYLINELKLFDKQFLPKFFAIKRNQNMEEYRWYCDYKKDCFVALKTIVSNLVLISCFSLLLCFNDLRNLFAFLILLLLRILDSFLFAKNDKENIKDISQFESTAFDNSIHTLDNLRSAGEIANKVALKLSFRKVIFLFVSICLALGMMLLNGITSTNYLIFHFGIYFLMSEAFSGVIHYLSGFGDRKIKRAQFLDKCNL